MRMEKRNADPAKIEEIELECDKVLNEIIMLEQQAIPKQNDI